MKSLISPEFLSDTISSIYDCALDPAAWPATLTSINEALGGAYAGVTLIETQTLRPIFHPHSPWDPVMMERLVTEYLAEIPGGMDVIMGPFDTPKATIASYGFEAVKDSRFYREWVLPQGLLDGCTTKICEAQNRTGMLSFVVPQSAGFVTADHQRVITLLAPHLRRSIMIGDVLAQNELTLARYQSAFDLMASPIILTNDSGQLLEANRAATEFLGRNKMLKDLNGRLTVSDINTRRAFQDALRRAARGDREIATSGIGIPLNDGTGVQGVCYVLPLNCSNARQLPGAATVGLFLTDSSDSIPAPAAILATLYDLTPSEAFLAVKVAQGTAVAGVAASLGISQNTAKSHLKRVYTKTGVGRYSELVALLGRLSPPARIEVPVGEMASESRGVS